MSQAASKKSEPSSAPRLLDESDIHDYQWTGIEYLLERGNIRAALWLSMGLGKTVIVLTAILYMMREMECFRVLVIAPKRVALSVWPGEIHDWAHLQGLEYEVLTGLAPKDREAAALRNTPIQIINRENVEWLVDFWQGRQEWPYDTVVIDESDSFKSHQANRFKALARTTPHTPRVIELTGTPAPSGLEGLWSQFYLLDRGERLGRNITRFRKSYFWENGYTHKYELVPGAEQKIYDKIDDLVLRMDASDHITLPAVTYNNIYVEMPSAAAARYRKLEKEYLIEVEELGIDIEAVHEGALAQKLLQFANGFIYDEDKYWHKQHGAKLDALEEIVSESQGQQILVAVNFQADRAMIKQRFGEQAVELGSDPALIDRWNKGDGSVPMLIVHPASAGHGLNLQKGGHILVWYGLNWGLGHYQQCNARLDRQGQTKPVVIHHIISRNTVDHTVMDRLAGKYATQKALLDALKKSIQERQK